jgi:hypothetical protein
MAALQTIDDIVYGRAFGALGLTVVVFQAIVLVMAVRRQRGARGPLSLKAHAIAGGLIALLPLMAGISVHAARTLMFSVYFGNGVDSSEKGSALGQGISAQLSAIPFAVSVTLLALLLWFIGAAFTLSTPRSDGRARGFPPAALVAVGLVPVALGALQWSASIIKTFAGLAGVAPEAKSAILERQLDAARVDLALYARVSMIAIPILALIAGVLIVVRGNSDAVTPRSPRSARLPLAVTAAVLVFAALLVLQARPTAAENELPWPPTTGSQYVYPGGPPTPDLAGPDAPQRAPVVIVFRDRLTLDGPFAVLDFDDLESKLWTLRTNFRLLHPGDDFDGMALIVADAATPIARLTSVLSAVCGSWYHRPMLAFTAKQTHVRPVFGKLERVVVTGARIRLACADHDDDPGEWKDAVPVRLQDFADYDSVARRVVELRRAGKPVVVKVERPSR